MMWRIFFFLFISSSLSSDFFFKLRDGEEKCFLVDVPRDILVLEKHRLYPFSVALNSQLRPDQDLDDSGTPRHSFAAPVGVVVEVHSPGGGSRSKLPTRAVGQFGFTAQEGGEHRLCLRTNGTAGWASGSAEYAMFLEVSTGAGAIDYKDVAKREHLSEIQVLARRGNDMVREILAEQKLLRATEESFRDTSEAANSRVVWWSLIEVMIFVFVGAWQMFNLRRFFKGKKIV